MIQKFRSFWAEEKSLFILLIILSVHIFVIIPLGQIGTFGRVLGYLFYILVITAGLNFLTKRKRYSVIILIASICVILLGTRIFSDKTWVAVLTLFFVIFYCGLLAYMVLLKTFAQGPITIYRIEGSIVGYLLIGLLFANVYHLIYQLEGVTAFNNLGETDLRDFLYFSLTTLTTVGYGDISPAIPISRSLANIESLIGQLYPAILIARLVSMEFTERK